MTDGDETLLTTPYSRAFYRSFPVDNLVCVRRLLFTFWKNAWFPGAYLRIGNYLSITHTYRIQRNIDVYIYKIELDFLLTFVLFVISFFFGLYSDIMNKSYVPIVYFKIIVYVVSLTKVYAMELITQSISLQFDIYLKHFLFYQTCCRLPRISAANS